VGEKTPTPLGPPSIDGVLGELVTAVDGAVVPADKSVVLVLVWDEAALLDELLPEVPVVDTASCPRDLCDESATKMSANAITDNRLISQDAVRA